MRKFFWILAAIGSIFGMFTAIIGIGTANGAPQECAAAAVGLAWAVIPYCLARAVSEMKQQIK